MVKRHLIVLTLCAAMTVFGCNSTETVLQPTPDDVANTSRIESSEFSSPWRVGLAPVVGAPVDAVSAFNKRFSLRARERGFALVSLDEGTGTHLLKGYFSAFTEGSQTTVVYVWDLLDTEGNRLHRFQGQEGVPVQAGQEEAWASVPAETMERIADLTAESVAVWLAAAAS